MESAEDIAPNRGTKTGTVAVGTVIAILSIFDALIFGLPTLLLALYFNPLAVFVVALAILVLVNVWACTWIDRKWDAWIVGTRFETRMQKVRTGKRAKRPTDWIQRGSNLWFAFAAVLLNAIQVIAVTRLITGRAVGKRRIVIASIAYSLFVAGIFSLFGFALGDVV